MSQMSRCCQANPSGLKSEQSSPTGVCVHLLTCLWIAESYPVTTFFPKSYSQKNILIFRIMALTHKYISFQALKKKCFIKEVSLELGFTIVYLPSNLKGLCMNCFSVGTWEPMTISNRLLSCFSTITDLLLGCQWFETERSKC